MGFTQSLVNKVIEEKGEDNVDLILETLFAYSACQNPQSESSGSLDGLFSDNKDDITAESHPQEVHELQDTDTEDVDVLTKGDNNMGDDRPLYAHGQLWLQRHHIMGRAVGSLCDAGTVEIIGPIAANVEDVMLVYAAVLGSSPSDRISLRSVHAALSEKEKVNVCYGLNYDTLSSEVYKHLTQNKKFPSKSAVQTLISPQCNLKSLRGGTDHPNPFIDSSCSFVDIDIKGKKDEACEQILLCARKLDLPAENEKLRANLQGMQWRVAELEKLRAKMQNQMTKMLKSRSSSHRNGRSLPRLCS